MGVITTPPRTRGGVPIAIPAVPLARQAPSAPIPVATPGDPLEQNPQARYGRLTNPNLLIAAGEWARVQSTFLWAIRFVPYAQAEDEPAESIFNSVGDLYIETNDGWIGVSHGRTFQDYRNYLAAPSKGKHHRRQPWYHSMETVQPQQYFGAALRKRIEENG